MNKFKILCDILLELERKTKSKITLNVNGGCLIMTFERNDKRIQVAYLLDYMEIHGFDMSNFWDSEINNINRNFEYSEGEE